MYRLSIKKLSSGGDVTSASAAERSRLDTLTVEHVPALTPCTLSLGHWARWLVPASI